MSSCDSSLPVLTLVGWQRWHSSVFSAAVALFILPFEEGRESLHSKSAEQSVGVKPLHQGLCSGDLYSSLFTEFSVFLFLHPQGLAVYPRLKFAILLPQSLKCWDFECVPLCLVSIKSVPQHSFRYTLVEYSVITRLNVTTAAPGCRKLLPSTACDGEALRLL